MKKIIIFAIFAAMLLFAACGSNSQKNAASLVNSESITENKPQETQSVKVSPSEIKEEKEEPTRYDIFKGWEETDKPQVKVFFLDVDQGHAALIQVKGGKTALIDAGPGGAGRNVIIPLLKALSIDTINFFFITHPHADHIIGGIELLENKEIKIDNFIDCGLESSSYNYSKLLKLIRRRPEIKYSHAAEGVTYFLDRAGKIKLHTLQAWTESRFSGTNDASTVLRLEHGAFSALITGDAQSPAENRLVQKHGSRLSSTVLKAGHHGSRTSTRADFLENVKPKYAIISAGRYNSYGHPHSQVMDRLRGAGIKIYQTAYEGTIMFLSDGEDIKIIHDKDFTEEKKRRTIAIDREAWALALSDSEANIRKSIELFNEGLKIDPGYIDFYSKTGYAYLKLEEAQNAKEILQKGKEISPNHFYTNQSLIYAYEKLGETENLKKQLNYFLNLNLPTWQRDRWQRHFDEAAEKLKSLQ